MTTTTGLPLSPDLLARAFAGGTANVSAERALEGLSAADAVRVPEPLPHSVAQILAHLQFWQAYLLAQARGGQPRWPRHAEGGWPPVREDEYAALRARFFEDLAQLQALARDAAFLSSLTKQPEPQPWANSFLSFATHNVYHLGQIVLTRRALGAWPPPSGGDTW